MFSELETAGGRETRSDNIGQEPLGPTHLLGAARSTFLDHFLLFLERCGGMGSDILGRNRSCEPCQILETGTDAKYHQRAVHLMTDVSIDAGFDKDLGILELPFGISVTSESSQTSPDGDDRQCQQAP